MNEVGVVDQPVSLCTDKAATLANAAEGWRNRHLSVLYLQMKDDSLGAGCPVRRYLWRASQKRCLLNIGGVPVHLVSVRAMQVGTVLHLLAFGTPVT
eukprot:5940967-Amphidinium_carterae.1